MLVIARALLTRPKAIMIDEMSAGLAPIVVARLVAAVRKLADDGPAVLLVEQFAALALSIGDRAYVLRRGQWSMMARARRSRSHPICCIGYISVTTPLSFPERFPMAKNVTSNFLRENNARQVWHPMAHPNEMDATPPRIIVSGKAAT